MPQLFLHVGSHKTGSSSIQQSLHSSKEVLRGAFCLYPSTGLASGNAHHSFALAMRGTPDQVIPGYSNNVSLASFIDLLRTELSSYSYRYCILSSEEFYTCLDQTQNFLELKNCFDSIHSILYLRHPLEHAISSYKFSVTWQKSKETADFGSYLVRYLKTNYYDYSSKATAMASFSDSYLIKNFSSLSRSNVDLIDDFLLSVNFPNVCSSGQYVTSNISGSLPYVLAIRLHNSGHFSSNDKIAHRDDFEKFLSKYLPEFVSTIAKINLISHVSEESICCIDKYIDELYSNFPSFPPFPSLKPQPSEFITPEEYEKLFIQFVSNKLS